MQTFYPRLEDGLSHKIVRAVGASGYDEIFTLLAGQRLSQLDKVKSFRKVPARHCIGGGVPRCLSTDVRNSRSSPHPSRATLKLMTIEPKSGSLNPLDRTKVLKCCRF